MLAEASATLSAGQGCEGIKTLSTPNVVMAHTKVYSKINSDDRVAVFDGQERDEGGYARHLLARTRFCLPQRASR